MVSTVNFNPAYGQLLQFRHGQIQQIVSKVPAVEVAAVAAAAPGAPCCPRPKQKTIYKCRQVDEERKPLVAGALLCIAGGSVLAQDAARGAEVATDFCVRCHDVAEGGAFKTYPPSFCPKFNIYRTRHLEPLPICSRMGFETTYL